MPKWRSNARGMRDVAYLALGSNLGDRAAYLAQARNAIARLPRTTVVGMTEVEETEPFGPPGQGKYLNQMIAIETELQPQELLAAVQDIEREAGRTRDERWGPRTLDIDIVKFERQSVSNESITVPHPGLPERDFWRRELDDLERRIP
jgi:2-amino-4-hydroxy-6-hydroxymethyldihydropteridine diphosphokinase